MFGLSSIKILLIAIPTVLFLATSALFYWYYTTSQAKIETLTTNMVMYQQAAALNEETVKILQDNFLYQSKELAKVQTERDKIANEKNNVLSSFRKHDLTVLSLQKPILIQNILNKANKELAEDLNKITRFESNTDE